MQDQFTPPQSKFPVLTKLLRSEVYNPHPVSLGTVSWVQNDFHAGELSLWDGSFLIPLVDGGSATEDDVLSIPSIPPYPKSWIEWGNGFASYVYESGDRYYTHMSVGIVDNRASVGMAWGRVVFDLDGIGNREYEFQCVDDWEELNLNHDLMREAVRNEVNLVGALFAFTHCKNVSIVEQLPSRQERRQAQKRGYTPVRYRTVVIDPTKQRSTNENPLPAASEDKPHRRIHLARGHFAHYTEDKPLFGKYTGTFWRPAHVRGSAEVGTVYKDYKVKPPK